MARELRWLLVVVGLTAACVELGAQTPGQEPRSPVVQPSDDFDLAERRAHWAYQPVGRPPLPAAERPEWCAGPIDRFILARLDEAGLSPSPPAERRALIRRVTFDLVGLPPTPQEVEAFLADHAPDTYERLVDRLLASPQHGERSARHWLDVVRYSETLGFEFDYDLYNAWRYRDYVVRALNADLPYDQFVVEHLAGDLLAEPRRHVSQHTSESILATGFFWMGEGKQTPVDIRQEQADRIENQIDVIGKAFLGQTIACARCHDHKFDAIRARDYYALAGYLRSSRFQQAFLDAPQTIAAKADDLAQLKAGIRRELIGLQASAWRKELSQANRYLLASAALAGKPEDDLALYAEVAHKHEVEPLRLKQWIKALAESAKASPEHPLYAWHLFAGTNRETLTDPPLSTRLKLQAEAANRLLARARPLADFRRNGFEEWFATGDAFGLPPAQPGDIILGERLERPISRLAAGGADSGLVALRLQGELRSPTFTIDKRFMHYRLAGRDARVNLVIDGNTLIMNPMYGKLTVAPASNLLAWHMMPVDRWIGHRAYVEVSDSTIPMHVLNPPPSTARVPDRPNGYIALEQVLLSDDRDPPAVPNRLNGEVLAAGENLQSLAAAYQDLMIRELDRWQAGKRDDASAIADGLALLNWLLESGLLDANLPEPEITSANSLDQQLNHYRQLATSLPAPQRAPALADGTGEDEFIFDRGDYRSPGELAPRAAPEVFAGPSSAPSVAGSGRLELARQLVAPSNPLLPRVLVNRIWQHHFGAGIVRTPDDFGRMGQSPTHPELLDHLAAELVAGDWSIKRLHRRMVQSATYRQVSTVQGPKSEVQRQTAFNLGHSTLDMGLESSVDPENRLLHRMNARRLEAEAIRDSLLAISGRLDWALYGPSVLPHLTPHMEGRGRPNSGPLDGDGRRSIYINARRNFLTPLLLAFDYPVTFTPIGRRGTQAIPAQALTLMNDPLVVAESARWAERVLDTSGMTSGEHIEKLYQDAFARPPSDAELQDALEFLEQQGRRHGGGQHDPRAWADLCHVLINTKEFIFIE